MTQTLFTAGLLLLCFSSCKKEKEVQVPEYSVSEKGDFVVDRNPFDKAFGTVLPQLFFAVKYERGESKRVAVSVEGLPAGITDSFSTRGGYPDFNTTLFLKDAGVAAGTYTPTLKLKVDGASEVMSYPFRVTLNGFGSCAAYFAGREFTATSSCLGVDSGTNSYTAISRLLSPFGDTVLISNYRNSGMDLKMVVDCKTRRATIPPQYLGDKGVQSTGYGQLSDDVEGSPTTLSFSVLEMNPGGPAFCDLVLKFK